MNSKLRTLLVWIVLVAAFVVLFQLNGAGGPVVYQDFSTFEADVQSGRVAELRVNGTELSVRLVDGREYSTIGILGIELNEQLWEKGSAIHYGKEESRFSGVLKYGIPVLLVVLALLYFSKRMGGQTGNILALRRSRARIISESKRITFDDVGGCEEAKDVFADVVDFLKNPGRWTSAGARLPRGILLEGPPGCGKTLLARAVAGETNATFFTVSASEFVEMFVGVGASRVRDMFETAVKQAPAVIFIDELDAVGRRRGSGVGAAHDEREQTLNQLLVSLDGFEANDRVVVIAATNRPDILDRALLRSGRFDRRIKVPALRREDRLAVLKIHTKNKPLAEDVLLEELAALSDGWTGAQIESLCNEAALLAARRCRVDGAEPLLQMADFVQALASHSIHEKVFSRLDMLLIESASQLSEPTGAVAVRVKLVKGEQFEGQLVWADAAFVKLRSTDGESERLIPKGQIALIERLGGTAEVERSEVQPDVWAGSMPDLA